MRKVQIFIGCDKTFAETGDYIAADETHTLGLDGEVVELDLTAERAAERLAWVRPWIRAGHAPGTGPGPPEPAVRPKPGQGRRRELPGTRRFYAAMRAFAAAQGAEVPLSGRQDRGKKTYDYPPDLPARFLAHLRAQAGGDDQGAAAGAAMLLAIAVSLGLDAASGTPAVNGVQPAQPGYRQGCARCHHPQALHPDRDGGTQCRARNCLGGGDGPCPGFVPAGTPSYPL